MFFMRPAADAPTSERGDGDLELLPLGTTPRPWRVLAMAALVGALLAVATHRGCTPGSWWRGETTLFGRRRFTPPHAVDEAVVRSMPFERIHRATLPRYLLALQHVDDEGARAEADAALRVLRRDLARDANLLELLRELDELARRDPRMNARRIRWLAWAWSSYLDSHNVPFRLEVSIGGFVGRSRVYFRVYRVVRDEPVLIAGRPYRARWVRRTDRTNLIETDLGHTSDADDGALVVADSVTDLAIDQVWPMLDPALDAQLEPLAQAHAPFVRAEARRALSPETFATLASTAAARRALASTARSIDGRAACGSVTRVGRLPLAGFAPSGIASARAWAEQTVRDECPELLPEEVDDIATASTRLRAEPGLTRAVSELLAWVSGSVAAHEARHAADDRVSDGLRTPLPCAACRSLGTSARAELSAFVTSFATPGVGRVAHYQACALTSGGLGPHADAMALLQRAPDGPRCEAPPRDLYASARALEQHFFHRDERVELPRVRPSPELLP